ncbi:SnoaL-like domain-containing protein [Phialemonium atrogriseum]|uniref:SnoaL-like domain-containing protein n=1 Tax=Phialemonium atrogriseum TaxID=1093897 RepID=A0AAJ0BVR4_9PEZI|nr:SnoaL-like domain-containing protein [Phialemonium atrogriseum]KAK1765353.1 SnoaL-like domain-containing protein [Phialemonium atrogriseum]
MKLPVGPTASLMLVLWTGVLWATAAAEATAVTAESLARDLARVESVREVKDLQRTFGQLAQYGRWGDMAALFSDKGVLRWGSGKGANILADSDATSVTGPAAIEAWLREDAGGMDGVRPGSLHALVNEMPLVSLSTDGRSAKARWHALRLMGDGAGKSRIQGGVFENEYALTTSDENGDRWKISLLRYYPLFAGDYKNGWTNVGGNNLPIVTYHFTPDDSGIPIMLPEESKVTPRRSEFELDVDELEYRISQLNEEDEVRNLQHSYGYYVDRQMWTDVIDLFDRNGTVKIDGNTYTGGAEIRKWLEKMGPEGLSRGILNDHPIFESIVAVGPDGREATTRGLEVGMIGDANAKTASWEFTVFRNHFIKDPDSGTWKIKHLDFTRLLVANYSAGWADGGILPKNSATTTTEPPAFLDVLPRSGSNKPDDWQPFWRPATNTTTTTTASPLSDLRRRLARSSAFDETENVSAAYGYYADDIRCGRFAALHAQKGFKESPGTGWYRTPGRIEGACTSRYGAGTEDPRRPNVPFHWRPQPVILVSEDGRSSSLRARILQTGTSRSSSGGFDGVWGFNGGMYHDQFVLEDFGNGTVRRKLWCLTIDEFYWQSSSWASGWAGVGSGSTKGGRSPSTLVHQPLSLLDARQASNFPPDVSLKDAKMTEREAGFSGGPTDVVGWPDIQRMWWSYRNPVSGRVPQDGRRNIGNASSSAYWGPGCVPCRTARPDWALMENGYQEPPTGPTSVTAAVKVAGSVTVAVAGGPGEPAEGTVELRVADGSADLVGSASLDGEGGATIVVRAEDLPAGVNELAVYYLGSDRLRPGRATVVVDVPE